MKIKYQITILLAILLCIAIIDLTNLDKSIHAHLFRSDEYDVPFWTVAQTIAVVGSVIIAYLALSDTNRNLKKQLEVEQTPFVVGKGGIFNSNKQNSQVTYIAECLYLKNIGRGMAHNITVSTVKDWKQDDRKTFFEGNQSHSIDLAEGEAGEPWKVWMANLTDDSINTDQHGNFSIYVYYSDQLENQYITRLQLCKIPDGYKVMSNTLEGKTSKKDFINLYT